MNSPNALLLILALAGQPAILVQNGPSVEPPRVERELISGGMIYRSGKLKFTYQTSGIDLELGTEKRHVDRNRLPVYTNDCRSSQCFLQPRTFCGACIKQFEFVAWDEGRQRVFFAIATDISQNKPWILAGYDFKSNRVTRLGEFYGGGAGDAVISPSGRYIAMKGYGVCGGCCTSTYLMVADLAAHRMGTEKPQTNAPQEPRVIVTVDWAGESEIVYDALSHKEGDCNAERKQSTGGVKLLDIAFR